jgi:hypothetical protein
LEGKVKYEEIKKAQVDLFIEHLKSFGELATLVKIYLSLEDAVAFAASLVTGKAHPFRYHLETFPTDFSNSYAEIKEYMLVTELCNTVAWGYAAQNGAWGAIIPTVILNDQKKIAFEVPIGVRDVIADSIKIPLQSVLTEAGLPGVTANAASS